MAKFTASVEDHLLLPAMVRLPPEQARMLGALGRSVPAPVPIRLVIDTGSKRTTLIPGIFDHLRPTVGGAARLITPLGSATTNLAWVSLEFPEAGLASFSEVLVARHPLPPMLSQFHGLLGRDLLGRLESFEYQGRRRRYVLRDTPGRLDWLRRWL
jgi:hypothetical protein